MLGRQPREDLLNFATRTQTRLKRHDELDPKPKGLKVYIPWDVNRVNSGRRLLRMIAPKRRFRPANGEVSERFGLLEMKKRFAALEPRYY